MGEVARDLNLGLAYLLSKKIDVYITAKEIFDWMDKHYLLIPRNDKGELDDVKKYICGVPCDEKYLKWKPELEEREK